MTKDSPSEEARWMAIGADTVRHRGDFPKKIDEDYNISEDEIRGWNKAVYWANKSIEKHIREMRLKEKQKLDKEV